MNTGATGPSHSEVMSMIRGELQPFVNELNNHARAINRMEAEMANVEGAVNHMAAALGQKLDAMQNVQAKLIDVQQTTQRITLEQFTAANTQLGAIQTESVAGFTRVVGGLGTVAEDVKVVDGSVQQLTRASVQMEVIRILNDARGPVERVKAFGEEIEQRFAKAVENVYLVRQQYDQLLGTAMTEYDRKLHTLGDHIFQVYEQDFRDRAEVPLSTPPEVFQELPLAVDERYLEARSAALDLDLEGVGARVLEPVLAAHHAFEHAMATEFSSRLDARLGEVAVPAAVRVYAGGARPADFVTGATLAPGAGVGERQGLNFAFSQGERLADVRAELTENAERVAAKLQVRALAAHEIQSVKDALAAHARAGLVDAALLQGYYDYLDAFGLEIVEGGTL